MLVRSLLHSGIAKVCALHERRIPRSALLVIASAFLTLSGDFSRAQSPGDLRNTYFQNVGRIESQYEEQKATIRVHYFTLLDEFERAARTQYPTGAQWARNEKLRYDQTPIIRVSKDPLMPEELIAEQKELKEAQELAQIRWEQEYIEFTRSYIEGLKTHLERSQKAQRTDEVNVLTDEINRTLENKKFAAAAAHFEAYQSGRTDDLQAIEAVVQETVIHEDSFDNSRLSHEWMASSDALRVLQSKLVATEKNTFLNLAKYFKGDIRVEIDTQKFGSTNNTDWDFSLTLKKPDITTRVCFTGERLTTFTLNEDSMQLGDQEQLLHPGTLCLIHRGGKVRAEYRDRNGRILATSWKPVKPFDRTFIQLGLNGAGSKSPRTLHEFRAISLPQN